MKEEDGGGDVVFVGDFGCRDGGDLGGGDLGVDVGDGDEFYGGCLEVKMVEEKRTWGVVLGGWRRWRCK